MTTTHPSRDGDALRNIAITLATSVLTSAGRRLWQASSLRTRAVLGAGMLVGAIVVLLSRSSAGSRRRAQRARRDEESRLDEAIEETFPASDPVSIHIE